ncbi:MAG TPA: ABC transporter permease [Beijerinckiaceae bacterium]
MTWAFNNLDRLLQALGQHVMLVGIALVLSLAIAVPLGIWAARAPRAMFVILAITGLLYTIPALALFALMIPIVGLGPVPAVTAIVLYSLLVLVRNVATGIRGVPPDVIEAANGMGFGPWRRLVRIELPLAMPVIVAGIRITAVMQIAVATVAAFIAAGGLGELIFQGISEASDEKLLAGAVTASLLAVATDEALRLFERRLRAAQAD